MWLRHGQILAILPAATFKVTESSGTESRRKIDSTFGKVVIDDANEGIAAEYWYVIRTDGNVCGHPCRKGVTSAREKCLLMDYFSNS